MDYKQVGTLWGKSAVGVEVGTKNYDPIFKVGVLLALWRLYERLQVPSMPKK